MRLMLPDSTFNKSERIGMLLRSISDWIDSDNMKQLIMLFGGKPVIGDLKAKLAYLNDFADVWDYRKKSAADNLSNERWNIHDDDTAQILASTIMEHSCALGLFDATTPVRRPDYILPLGGARLSNLDRPLYARSIIDRENYHGVTIVALSGMRQINEAEREMIDSYAPSAMTEFDAINSGLEHAFDLGKAFTEEHHHADCINLCSCVRRYNIDYNGGYVYSVAAPSSDKNRRANSRDTFDYFLKTFNIAPHTNLLLVTTQIYVPYQLLKFADLAIEHGFNVDCIGDQMNVTTSFSRPSNYLQEIKSTINAMTSLYDLYKGADAL